MTTSQSCYRKYRYNTCCLFGLPVIECLLYGGVRDRLDFVILKFKEIHPTLTLKGSDVVDTNQKEDKKETCSIVTCICIERSMNDNWTWEKVQNET